MAIDTRFYKTTLKLTSDDIVSLTGATHSNGMVFDVVNASGAHDLQTGGICFIASESFIAKLPECHGASIITTPTLAKLCPQGAAIYVTPNPRLAFAKVLSALYQNEPKHRIAATAQISRTAQIGDNVHIDDYVVIGDGVIIGDDCIIASQAVINDSVVIGKRCVIEAGTVISYALIGDEVKIGAQTVIGKEGFGFEMTEEGAVRIPHLGLVEIRDGVHIGAHCAIDKGVLENTIIKSGTMIDNLVHIAHNVEIGHKSIILGQVGIAGSAHIGDGCILAGQVGVKDHVSIASKAIILSAAKVIKSIDRAGTYAGNPAVPATQHWREVAALKKLTKAKQR